MRSGLLLLLLLFLLVLVFIVAAAEYTLPEAGLFLVRVFRLLLGLLTTSLVRRGNPPAG